MTENITPGMTEYQGSLTENITTQLVTPEFQGASSLTAMPLSVTEVLSRVKLIQQVMESVMIEDVHYGVIPGTSGKKTLLKPGAEKLSQTFRLNPEFIVERHDLPNGHREYEITCRLLNTEGNLVAEGVANCSTLESKYRWRNTSLLCPDCQQPLRKSKKDPGYYCWNNPARDANGCGATFLLDDSRIAGQSVGKTENPDIADAYNTVKKMAKKRAHVDAVLTATAASDIFAQDMESGEPASPTPSPSPPPPTPPPPTPPGIGENPWPSKPSPPPPAPKPAAKSNNNSTHQPATYFIAFKSKPDQKALDYLRSSGYRYSPEDHHWYAPEDPKAAETFQSVLDSGSDLLDTVRTRKVESESYQDDLDNEKSSLPNTDTDYEILPFDDMPPPNSEWEGKFSDNKINFLKDCKNRKETIGDKKYYEVLNKFQLAKSNQIHPEDVVLMTEVLTALRTAIIKG